MGNSATISISLDYENNATSPEAYLAASAGDIVRGAISVEVTRLVKNADGVHLLICGKEKASLKSPSGVDRVNVKSERNLVRSHVVVKRYREKTIIRPGSYRFPFSFYLPSVLPTSMHWVSGSNWCSIKYKLKAFIGGTSVKTERPFFVAAAPLPNALVPCFLDPTTRNLKSIGLTKGSVTFGVSVKDTHIGRDKNLEICFSLRNNSTVDIKEVGVKLIEILVAKSQGRVVRDMRTLSKMRFEELGKQKRPRSEIVGNRRAGIDPQETNYQEIFDELVSERYKISFRIPKNARDSYNAGQLISVAHHLEITYHTKQMVDNPSVRIPLKIGYPPARSELPANVAPSSTPTAPQPEQEFPIATTVSTRPIAVPIVAGSEMPVAVANPLPASYAQVEESEIVEIPLENIIVGGTATDDATAWAGLVPVPPPPTLAALMEEMTAAVNDFDIVSTRVVDPSWRHVFSSLSPDDFGGIIAHVNVDFDQPRVASCLAPHVGNEFSHEYIISALKNTASWNRTTMLHELLPFCVDYETGREPIMAELSTWEQTVSARDFTSAGQRAAS